jgi:uncharacterized membrane protein
MAADKQSGLGGAVAGGLAHGAKGLAGAMGKRLLSSATDRMGETTKRLTEFVSDGGGGGGGLFKAITGGGGDGGGGGGGGGGQSAKITNIVESIDVGVPIRLAYNQWTQFTDFPSFMKKVESVEQEDEVTTQWRAQIFMSHRNWKATITEQIPDKRIVWRSEGAKGYVDGAVTFHEIGPELTRIVVVLQYHPQGFFEKTANMWRAQGRRARLELKHFVRHVMTEAVLNPDDIQGWRGEVHDGEVTKDDEAARREEQEGQQEGQEGQQEGRPEGRQERRPRGREEDRQEEQHGAPRRREHPRRHAREAA